METSGHRFAKMALHAWTYWRAASMDLVHIEARKAFLKTVQIVRLTAVRLYGIGLLILLSMMTIAMLHIAVYVAFPEGQKVYAALLLAAVDLLGLLILSYQLFSEKKWMEYSDYCEWAAQQQEQHAGNGNSHKIQHHQ